MLAGECRALVGVCVKNMFEDLFSIVSCAIQTLKFIHSEG